MKKKIVIGIGEALWDCLPEGRKLGGAPANFAYHAQAQGCEGHVVSAIGKDALGNEIIEQLTDKGLNLAIDRIDAPTGTVLVTLTEGGIPSYNICEGVAWDCIPWTNSLKELALKADAVCFGSLAQRNDISRETIKRFVGSTPADALRIFDINLRQNFYTAGIIDQSLKLCNVLKINDEEWEIVRPMFGIEGTPNTTEGLDVLIRRYNLKMLILTCGTNGSYVFYRDPEVANPRNLEVSIKSSFQPTPLVEVVDTVGAGDSFTGSFVASILSGKTVEEAHKKAMEVSAFVCTQAGPMPTFP